MDSHMKGIIILAVVIGGLIAGGVSFTIVSESEDAIAGKGIFSGIRNQAQRATQQGIGQRGESRQSQRGVAQEEPEAMSIDDVKLYLADYRDGVHTCAQFCEERRRPSCATAVIWEESKLVSCDDRAQTDLALYKYRSIECLCVR
ncbi:TPA: hypothetical protein HA278_02555 [Candidatus Woesearchaeota archaeon]|nr:hypothetical protein [Candidatus Woesearchaeota archaeon]